MTDPTMQQILARLAAQDAKVAAMEGRLNGRARHARSRGRTRRASALLVAILVALTPLALLAAAPFTDLTGGPHDTNIGAIYDAGITTGCVPNQEYCPTAAVTREEMASFLARTAGLGTNPPVVNAKTAQSAANAQNAAQLGGQSASAYLRRDSADFSIVQQLVLAGPLPATRTFTSHGGSLLVFASGSAYSTVAGNISAVEVFVDDKLVGIMQVAANEALSHKALAPVAAKVSELPAGDHTIKFIVSSLRPTTQTDAYDLFNLTVLELPIP